MFSGSFIGRCGKDAEIVHGANGDFVSINVAESYYSKGETRTRWYRVRSNTPRALKMAQYWTKGRQLEVVGEINDVSIYENAQGKPQYQIVVSAFRIEFVASGKTQEVKTEGAAAENNIAPVSDADIKATPQLPFEAPAANAEENLPF